LDLLQHLDRRPKMTQLADDLIQYTKYKWEFLRRNPKYIDEWEQLQEVLEKEYGDWQPPNGRLTDEEIDFCKRWNIHNPICPDNSYDDMIQSFSPPNDSIPPKVSIDPHRIMYERLHVPEPLGGRPVIVLDGYERLDSMVVGSVSERPGVLTIEVDLNYSKNRLMKELKTALDEWKQLYEDEWKKRLYLKFREEKGFPRFPTEELDTFDEIDIHMLPIHEEHKDEFEKIYKKELKKRKRRYKQKLHFDNFDLYLQVYDLREKKVSWAKIKSTLGLNSKQTARNHWLSACEVIEKGIELYVKIA